MEYSSEYESKLLSEQVDENIMIVQKVKFTMGQRLIHRHRGEATFTELCSALQALNVDPSSIFIQLDCEDVPIEVSTHLVKANIKANELC